MSENIRNRLEDLQNTVQSGYEMLEDYISEISERLHLTPQQERNLRHYVTDIPENRELNVPTPTVGNFIRFFTKEMSRIGEMKNNVRRWLEQHEHELNLEE